MSHQQSWSSVALTRRIGLPCGGRRCSKIGVSKMMSPGGLAGASGPHRLDAGELEEHAGDVDRLRLVLAQAFDQPAPFAQRRHLVVDELFRCGFLQQGACPPLNEAGKARGRPSNAA